MSQVPNWLGGLIESEEILQTQPHLPAKQQPLGSVLLGVWDPRVLGEQASLSKGAQGMLSTWRGRRVEGKLLEENPVLSQEAKQAKNNQGPASLLIQSQPRTLYSWGCEYHRCCRTWGTEGFSMVTEYLFVVLFWEFSFGCAFPTFLLLSYHSLLGSANPLAMLYHLHRMEAHLPVRFQDV